MGIKNGRRRTSRYGAGTLCGQAFKPVPLTRRFVTPARPVGAGNQDPTTPCTQPPTGIARARFGLIRFRSPLLTEYPFLQVLRCFTSLRTPGDKSPVPAHDDRRVPPFGDPRIKALLEAPLGLSHPQTSFIGTVCQGIHPTPSPATPHAKTHGRRIHSKIPPDDKSSHYKMITKRSISNQTPNGVWRNRDKATENETVSRLLASTIQFSNHHARRHTPTTRKQPLAARDGRRTTPHHKQVRWRSGSPKAYPYHSPNRKTPAGKPLISSTPATPTRHGTIPHAGAHHGHHKQAS